MSTATIPTRGVARRRAKAIARRTRVHQIENDVAVAAGRLPPHWTSLDTCPCGRVSWLEDDATDEDRDAFYRDSENHASYCGVTA